MRKIDLKVKIKIDIYPLLIKLPKLDFIQEFYSSQNF